MVSPALTATTMPGTGGSRRGSRGGRQVLADRRITCQRNCYHQNDGMREITADYSQRATPERIHPSSGRIQRPWQDNKAPEPVSSPSAPPGTLVGGWSGPYNPRSV